MHHNLQLRSTLSAAAPHPNGDANSQDTSSPSRNTEDESTASRSVAGAATTLPVQIHIQRTTIWLGGVANVSLVVVAMCFCVRGGVVLDTFLSSDKDDPARKKLLDAYNSYSGLLASVLVKPVELFFAMVLAVGLLCFATEMSVGEQHSTRARYILLAATAATGYLLTNGFNAINVQLVPRPMHFTITARDLSQRAVQDDPANDSASSTRSGDKTRFESTTLLDTTLLEESPKNPSSNTVLRSAFLPIEPVQETQCHHWRGFEVTGDDRDATTMSYGFPQRPWQRYALPKAVEPTKALELALGTNASTEDQKLRVLSSHGVDGSALELPMDTPTAISLVLHGILLTEEKLKWWTKKGGKLFLDQLAIAKLVENAATARRVLNHSDYITATYPDLFFNASASPSNKDVLLATRALLRDFFSEAANVSSADVRVQFGSVQLASCVTLDSITMEIPLVPSHLSRHLVYDDDKEGYTVQQTPRNNATTNSTAAAATTMSSNTSSGDWFYDIDSGSDCSADACVVNEQEFDRDGNKVTIEAQVQAQPVYWDATAQRESPPVVRSRLGDAYSGSTSIDRTVASNSSMRIVSIGKRIQGDAIAIASVQGSNTVVRLKNARKVYSITIGQLSWATQDLAKVYGADCIGTDAALCHGLRLDLSGSDPKQHLLVGSRYIPTSLLQNLTRYVKSTTPLVSFATSRLCESCTKTYLSSADLVLPRRFANVTGFVNAFEPEPTRFCSASAERFVSTMEINHMYIEKSLQPAYSAALFFLFQDGVVHDVLNTTTTAQAHEALAFLRNTQHVDVRLSSPLPNVVLTLLGSAILLAITVGIGVFGGTQEAKLQRLATAHTIVEALINEKKFPGLLTKSTIERGGGGGGGDGSDDRDMPTLQLHHASSAKSGRHGDAGAEVAILPSLDGFRISAVTLVHADGRRVELETTLEETRGLAVM